MGKKLLASVTGLFIFSILLNAQDVFTASVVPSVVSVGDQFHYVVEGSERGEVRLPAMDNSTCWADRIPRIPLIHNGSTGR